MKGLIRKRSTTAARLQRAFSAKSLRTAAANPAVSVTPSGSNSPGGSNDMGADSPIVSSSPASMTSSTPVKNDKEKRQFIMETSVQYINVSYNFYINLKKKKKTSSKSFLLIISGTAKSRSSFVSVQRPVADRQSAIRRSFQIEG